MDGQLSEREIVKRKIHLLPQTGKNVWPKDSCPSYLPRRAIMAGKLRQCWYCQYADFHLGKETALEVGICCYPVIQKI